MAIVWDGAGWQPAVSPDRRWRWDGRAWIAIGATRPTSGFRLGRWRHHMRRPPMVVLVVVSVMAYVGFSRSTGNQSSGGLLPTRDRIPHVKRPVKRDSIRATRARDTRQGALTTHWLSDFQFRARLWRYPPTLAAPQACYYWLHMHTSGDRGSSTSSRPATRIFTLGDFFQVWGAWTGTPQRWIQRTSHRITFERQLKASRATWWGRRRRPGGVPGDRKRSC